ncbi:BPSS1780 family membrane protein [Amphritea sp. 1_MG-2023]|uniref:BPSS1780 family membrane protein n=1 Tax=Amphritea sp. 1_MG-2023 TaxID=3062670 RepID=UPI0026E39EDD|nr:BPSS1780 family membrane protein [Amphritea sp. 1_MG-2023]MDO6562229.1 BPSS1780 family membrane protein [Amphritea sp. 1_MG-2023]
MTDQFKVVFTGALLNDREPAAVISAFAEKFRCSEAKARGLITAGKATVIKSGLERLKADKYQTALTAIGLEVEVVALKPTALFGLEGDEADSDETTSGTASGLSSCPKCGSKELSDDRCLSCHIVISKYLALQAGGVAPRASEWVARAQPSDQEECVKNAADGVSNSASDNIQTNPYRTPEAELTQAYDDGDLTGPVTLPASHGWRWLAEGFNHFKLNPVAWIVAIIIWLVLSTIISIIPVIGSLVITLLSPVITAGFMLGCQAQDEGDDFSIGHLFSGFSHNVGQLMLVGLLYLVAIVVIVLALSLFVGGAVVMFGDNSQNMGPGMMSALLLPMLIGFLCLVPVMMAYWFAPVLVVLNDMSAISAMKMSFSGCLKNMLPGLLYSIMMMVLFVVAIIPFGLGLLVVIPMIVASMYTAYRDIFYS